MSAPELSLESFMEVIAVSEREMEGGKKKGGGMGRRRGGLGKTLMCQKKEGGRR